MKRRPWTDAELAEWKQEWQTMETAPKDGSRILLVTPSGKIADGFWSLEYRVWSWPYVMVEPTHWTRSLPIPGRKGEGSDEMPTMRPPAGKQPHMQEQEGQHPLEGLHINQGSMDAAADAYETEYNAAQEARRAEHDAEMRADAFGPKHG